MSSMTCLEINKFVDLRSLCALALPLLQLQRPHQPQVPQAGSEFQTASQLDVVPHNATRRRSFRELPRRPVYIEELGECTSASAHLIWLMLDSLCIEIISSACLRKAAHDTPHSCGTKELRIGLHVDEAAQRRKAMLRAMTKADRIKSGIDEVRLTHCCMSSSLQVPHATRSMQFAVNSQSHSDAWSWPKAQMTLLGRLYWLVLTHSYRDAGCDT